MARRSSNPQPALGAAIRELRSKEDMTQEALAHQASITVAYLSSLERGHANPTWGTVERIADALGVPLGALVKAVERHKG